MGRKMTMPAIQSPEKRQTWQSQVGERKLPFSKQEYKARAPVKSKDDERKNEIFKCVWLPVNASNRTVVDRQQDLMHMRYSVLNNNRIKTSQKSHSANITADGFLSNVQQRRLRYNQDLPISYDLTRSNLPRIELEPKPVELPDHVKIAMWKTGHNTMAPFASLGKPTCGHFFTRNVSHKKRLIGINATNTVKWRSNVDILNIKKKNAGAVKKIEK